MKSCRQTAYISAKDTESGGDTGLAAHIDPYCGDNWLVPTNVCNSQKNPEPEARQRTFAQEAEQEILHLPGARDVTGRIDFDAVETSIRSSAMNFAASLLERFPNRDDSDHRSSHVPCCCSGTARYRGRHWRRLTGR